MAKFKFTGDSTNVFPSLIAPDGSTVEVEPGEEFEVERTVGDTAVLHPELEAVDQTAKTMVTLAEEKARIAGSRQVEVTEGVPVAEDPPTAPAAPAKAAKDPTETAPTA